VLVIIIRIRYRIKCATYSVKFTVVSFVFLCCSDVADKHKGVAGMMAAFSLILGIFCGIIFSFPMTLMVETFGSSHYEPLVCDLPGVTEGVTLNVSSTIGLNVVTDSIMP